MKKITTIGILIYLCSQFAWAAGIDDIANSKPVTKTETQASPYTIEEIIAAITDSLNDELQSTGLPWIDYYLNNNLKPDPRINAFDKRNFGECEALYVQLDGRTGGHLLSFTLKYLFPKSDEERNGAVVAIKNSLEKIKKWPERSSECANWDVYVGRLKSLLNSVVEAAPSIRKNKQENLIQANQEHQRQVAEMAAAKQAQDEALRKINAEKAAAEQAAEAIEKQRHERIQECLKSNNYTLYQSTLYINILKQRIELSQKVIAHENEVEKASGTRNLTKLNQAGSMLVNSRSALKSAFEEYKKLGGTASNAQSVQAISDPCSSAILNKN